MKLILSTLVLLIASTACAFSDAGHKIVASIAFRQLTPEQQTKIITILKSHPRFQEDFGGSDESEWLFQQAAVWPDIARGFKGDDTKFHHSTWHYINQRLRLLGGDVSSEASFETPATAEEKMNIVQTIRYARKALNNPDVGEGEKAILLAWLFHTVGDIHQPLHSISVYSPRLFPDGDRGGNLIPTKQGGNLHALWDGFPGGKMELKDARNKAIVLVNDKDMEQIGHNAEGDLNEEHWLSESYKLGVLYVYSDELLAHLKRVEADGGELPPYDFSEAYLKVGGKTTEIRVVEAGYRLGAVLKEIAK